MGYDMMIGNVKGPMKLNFTLKNNKKYPKIIL